MPSTTDPALALADMTSWRQGPPHHLFDALRESGPVAWIPGDWGTLRDGYWAVLSHAEVGEVGTHPEIYTSTVGAAYPTFAEELAAQVDNMVQQDDPRHERLRAYAWRPFTPKVVSRFDDWVRDVVRECLDGILARQRFDGVADVAAVIPARVICDLIGVPIEDRDDVLNWTFDIFERGTPDGAGQGLAVSGYIALMSYALELRDRKRLEPGVDLISEMVAAPQTEDPLTDREFSDLIMTLLGAGFETTHTLISQSMRMITGDRQIAADAKAAVSSGGSRLVNEEFLRLVTPAMNMARVTTVDTVLGGVELAADQRVVMWFAAANRDPLVFEEPHKFVAARSPNKHLAFGSPGSPHFCLGHALGRLVGRVFLEEFFLRDLKLEFDGDHKYKEGPFINALKTLPLAITN